MKALKSTTDEIQGLLERKMTEFDELKVKVEALRAEADNLWSSRNGRLEEIEALQKVFRLLNGGVAHLFAEPGPAGPTRPQLADSDFEDDPNTHDNTPGHTTSIGIAQITRKLIPISAYSITQNALKAYGKPIRKKELCALIHRTHPWVPSDNIGAYLSRLYQHGLANRLQLGVYVWVSRKGKTNHA